MKNKKDDVLKCDIELECKASASLKEEIKEDLVAEDKSLEELIQNDKTQEPEL